MWPFRHVTIIASSRNVIELNGSGSTDLACGQKIRTLTKNFYNIGYINHILTTTGGKTATSDLGKQG